MNANTYFLIGYMGSGKTTIGKSLAEGLGVTFLDLDQEIEKKFNTTITQIFQEKGEEEFRKIEAEMLREVSKTPNILIATGGGAPCFGDNMQYMKQTGMTLYLKVSPDILYQRLLKEKDKRPLLAKYNDKELRSQISKQLVEREKFYRQANISLTFDITLRNMIALIKEKSRTFFPK